MVKWTVLNVEVNVIEMAGLVVLVCVVTMTDLVVVFN